MFENLRTELNRKNISIAGLARLIGATEKTMQNKLQGRTEFRLSEIMMIHDELLPEFELKYLFKR